MNLYNRDIEGPLITTLDSLPEELLLVEIVERLREERPAMVWVLSKVSKIFHRLLTPVYLSESPLQEFVYWGYVELVRWDHEGPSPCLLSEDVRILFVNAEANLLP
jgi:hypothetical protein